MTDNPCPSCGHTDSDHLLLDAVFQLDELLKSRGGSIVPLAIYRARAADCVRVLDGFDCLGEGASLRKALIEWVQSRNTIVFDE